MEVRDLGFDVGRALWESVQRENDRYVADACVDKRGGKREHCGKEEIEAKWQKCSYEGSGGGRVIYGSKANSVAKIANELENPASFSTIRKYCPQGLHLAKRPTDLCPVCEEGRRLRIKLVKKYGAGMPPGANDSETRQESAKDRFACNNLDKNALAKDGDYQVLLAIERHEDLAATLSNECKKSLTGDEDKSKIICIVDWAGKMETKSFRQDAAEFYNPTRLEMMGMVISLPRNGGQTRDLVYIHAYDLRARVRKNGHRSATAIEECLVVARKLHYERQKRNPRKFDIWMDTARHYRNKLLMYHMLVASSAASQGQVTLKWFAEHHGKTVLDASFRWARRWVSERVDYGSVKRGEITMEKSIIGAYRNADGKERDNYKVHFLAHPNALGHFAYGRRSLNISHVSSVHELSVAQGSGKENRLAINKSYGGSREISIEWSGMDAESDGDSDSPPREWGTKQELHTHKTRILNKFEFF